MPDGTNTVPNSGVKPNVLTLEQRIDSIDKAIVLVQENVNRMPTPAIVDEKLSALKELTQTKFDGIIELINEKFASVNSQFEQGNVALAAALNAAEKAVKEQNTSNTTAIDKAEKGFKELLTANGSRVDSVEKASEGKIGDVKEGLNKLESRLTTIESRANGVIGERAETRDKTKDNTALVFSIISAGIGLVSMVGVIIAIVIALKP